MMLTHPLGNGLDPFRLGGALDQVYREVHVMSKPQVGGLDAVVVCL